jgi:hypothetical protein
MAVFWFWVLLLLLFLILATMPAWPHSRSWGYGPSAGALVALLFFLGLFWFGILAIWWPWQP